jgi:hypothetical protein
MHRKWGQIYLLPKTQVLENAQRPIELTKFNETSVPETINIERHNRYLDQLRGGKI